MYDDFGQRAERPMNENTTMSARIPIGAERL